VNLDTALRSRQQTLMCVYCDRLGLLATGCLMTTLSLVAFLIIRSGLDIVALVVLLWHCYFDSFTLVLSLWHCYFDTVTLVLSLR
jgi:hypothetical protein